MHRIAKREAIQKVLDELAGPAPVDKVVERVLELWPSRAKNPRSTIRQEIHRHSGREIVFPDQETVAPLWSVLDGVRFRVAVMPREAEEGYLVAAVLHPFVPHRRELLEALRLVDEQGEPLPTRVITVNVQVESLFGPREEEMPALDLAAWFVSRRVEADDSILFTISSTRSGHRLDRRAGRLALEHEPADRRQEGVIARQNRELADLIYDLVLDYWMRDAPVTDVILTAYARLSDPRGYPGDHWADVVEEDHRLQLGYHGSISLSVYRDAFSLMEEHDSAWPIPLSPEQERLAREREAKVYRFKAAFKHRKGLWRRLEILGSQTLGGLDDTMRAAFRHDFHDHLSQFYLPIGGRRRPVGLGHIEPWGGGEGREPLVSHLGLETGDRLEYVYDFGDRIEHQLTLEAIEEPEEGAEYPRQVGQNKPRYRYCERCKGRGKKTIATWMCIDCSNREQRSVLVCEDCLLEYHADHYVEEMVY